MQYYFKKKDSRMDDPPLEETQVVRCLYLDNLSNGIMKEKLWTYAGTKDAVKVKKTAENDFYIAFSRTKEEHEMRPQIRRWRGERPKMELK